MMDPLFMQIPITKFFSSGHRAENDFENGPEMALHPIRNTHLNIFSIFLALTSFRAIYYDNQSAIRIR